MNLYSLFLGLHSWVRWILVLSALLIVMRSIYGLLKNTDQNQIDTRLGVTLFWALNIQFVIGLVLYLFFSPYVQIALNDFSAAMSDASLRFFLIEHPLAMILAIGAGHAGLKRAGKASASRDKHKTTLKWIGACLLFIIVGIPWPFLPYGRALFFL